MREKDKEYLMMRDEILQFLNAYQLVRNMMYLVTATTLGFGIKNEMQNWSYLFLLPLIVILPSYLVTASYWEGVIKASTYLMVFHEQEEDCSFHWETRHYLLKEYHKPNRKVNIYPYIVCSGICILLYFVNLNYKSIFDILLGIATLLICICVFYKYKYIDDKTYIKRWMKIKLNGDESFKVLLNEIEKEYKQSNKN